MEPWPFLGAQGTDPTGEVEVVFAMGCPQLRINIMAGFGQRIATDETGVRDKDTTEFCMACAGWMAALVTLHTGFYQGAGCWRSLCCHFVDWFSPALAACRLNSSLGGV